jgi:hypothetical protein
MRHIFVFGSNLAGFHGAGSAKEAVKHWGAIFGQGSGPQGDSYAIPTKDYKLRSLPLEDVKEHVDEFLTFARTQQDFLFHVVKIGCGLAGFTEDQIKPFFKDAPGNCLLPIGWRDDG